MKCGACAWRPTHPARTAVATPAGEQLAAVRHDGRFVGVITLSDVLRRVLPMELTPAGRPG
jgi:CBS domain-containing protein